MTDQPMKITDKVRMLHAQGLTVNQIAERLGIIRERVTSAIKSGSKMGRPRKWVKVPVSEYKP